MSDHECDDPDCQGPVVQRAPTWEWHWHDIFGIWAAVIGGIFSNIGAGFGMLSNEFYASARWHRLQRNEARAQVRNDMTFAELVNGMMSPEVPDVDND